VRIRHLKCLAFVNWNVGFALAADGLLAGTPLWPLWLRVLLPVHLPAPDEGCLQAV
jgi:hypothetical protein